MPEEFIDWKKFPKEALKKLRREVAIEDQLKREVLENPDMWCRMTIAPDEDLVNFAQDYPQAIRTLFKFLVHQAVREKLEMDEMEANE